LPVYKVAQTIFKSGEYEEPRNKLEARLLDIWQGLLKIKKIGINMSFFRAGGSSLKAILMVSKIEKALHIALSLREIFNHSTIKKLARYIEENTIQSDYSGLNPAEKRDRYPLSSAQQRLYILNSINPGDVTYNVPVIMLLEGEIDIPFMEETFKKLMQRHESLRTSFHLVNGEPVQKIQHPQVSELEVEYYEAGIKEQGVGSRVANFIRPFDLSRPPLMHVGLIKISANQHVFIVDMHHIVSDGTSLILLVNEFAAIYGNEADESLLELHLQYKDFSSWQNSNHHREMIKKQEVYWLNRFKGDLPVLNIPRDFPRPEIKGNKGAYCRFELANQTSEKLRMLAVREDATMFMVALTFFKILLFKLSGQEDIIVGTVTAGRRLRDLENIVGMFINTLALRNYPRAGMSFIEFLKEVRETTLEAFDNEDYQFEDLVDKLVKKRDAARNPLFDVLFAFGQVDMVDIERSVSAYEAPPDTGSTGEAATSQVKGLQVKPFASEVEGAAKFDMIFSGGDRGEKLVFSINYCTELFKEDTISKFSNYFKEVVQAVLKDETILLKDISISHNLETAESDIYRDQESNFEF
jgi:acyl carrier protein